jgi:hypothetical protein
MGNRKRWSRILYLVAAGLILGAVAIVYITAPPPTVLRVRVVEVESGRPLTGAAVRARIPGEASSPALLSDDKGEVEFRDLVPDSNYIVRVQLVDHDLAVESPVAVAEGEETRITVMLAHDPGARLYVGLDRARVVEIDTASLQVLQTVVLAGAPEAPVRQLRLHPAEGLLYALIGDQGRVLSTASGATLARLEVAGSIDSLEPTADGRYVVAAGLSEADPTGVMAQRHLWLLDARSGRLVSDTLLSRMQPDASLATVWQPDGQDGYILRATNPEIDRLAEQRGGDSPFFRVPVGITSREPKMVLSADGQYYYWWAKGYSPDRGEVSLLALAALEDGAAVFQEVPAGVSAIAASPVRQELFVLNSSLGTLTIIDLTGERAQVLVPVGKQPEQMTVSSDGSRAYVADAEADSILVVDLDSASVSYVLPLPGEPLSLATE